MMLQEMNRKPQYVVYFTWLACGHGTEGRCLIGVVATVVIAVTQPVPHYTHIIITALDSPRRTCAWGYNVK